MRRRLILVSLFVSVAALLVFAVKEAKGNHRLPAEVERALSAPEEATLFSLEPGQRAGPGEANLSGFKVLGQAKLDLKEAGTAAAAFRAAVAGWDGAVASCFNPHHALRVTSKGHTYDLILCYECQQLYIYRDDALLISLGVAGSSDVLNTLLSDHKAPLPYSETKEGRAAKQKENEENRKKYNADQERWLAAMPKSVRALWTDKFGGPSSPDLQPLHAAILREQPDAEKRSEALFGWFGSGSGPWSGYPAYEEVAEKLLLDIPTPDLIAAAQHPDLSDAQIEGAARLFGGWTFSQKRPNDLKTLPPALKKKLLDHSLKSTDDDKLDRARDAFK